MKLKDEVGMAMPKSKNKINSIGITMTIIHPEAYILSSQRFPNDLSLKFYTTIDSSKIKLEEMAQTKQGFHYQSFHINKSQPLGHGSFGAVYKAKCDQLPCAAKVLHPTILDPADPGAGKIMDRFQQECGFLESIRHPNIVQYLGTAIDPESRLPVLLMELLDESLTKMLEHSQQSLAYCVQVDICHDIALAVAYLHSNDIIHRDLSSNNVLMIAGRRAKVTDFGMSKLVDSAPSMTPLTMCPGTLAYMPPEALREPPRCTKKMDCFSEGVIMIQVCTRLWPEPGPRTRIVEDTRSPMGVIEMPVSDTERRKSHIDVIDPNHPLLPTAIRCLRYQESERPSSKELCQTLGGLMGEIQYSESAQQSTTSDKMIFNREKFDTEAKNFQKEKRKFQEEIASRERQLQQLSQQLEEQEQVTAEIQQTNHSLQRQVEQLQQQLSQQSLKPPQPPPPSQAQVGGRQLQERESREQLPGQPFILSLQRQLQQHLSQPPPPSQAQVALRFQVPINKIATLTWKPKSKSRRKMARGMAVVHDNKVYFAGYLNEMVFYNMTTDCWNEIPNNRPYKGGSLAVVDGLVTTIGGYDQRTTPSNRLHRLKQKHSPKAGTVYLWEEFLPPMPTKRYGTMAVTTTQHLIVAGGESGVSHHVNTVEVMDIHNLVWSTVASLPHPYTGASGTICGDRIFMLGGMDEKGYTTSVLTCIVEELLQSSWSSSGVWHRVADVPFYRSTCATVNGELLAVGGVTRSQTKMPSVYKYNPTTNSWDLISKMPTARYLCQVAVLPDNEIMVVGGHMGTFDTTTDKVEVASVTLKD